MNAKRKILIGAATAVALAALSAFAIAANVIDRFTDFVVIGNGAATLKNLIFDTGHGAGDSFFAAGAGGTSLQACTDNTHCMTVPHAADTFVGRATSDQLTNKSILIADSDFFILDGGHQLTFDASALSTDRSLSAPNASGTLALLERAQTFTAHQTVSSAGALTLSDTGGVGNVPHNFHLFTASSATPNYYLCCDGTTPGLPTCSTSSRIAISGGCVSTAGHLTANAPIVTSSKPQGWNCQADGTNMDATLVCMDY